MAKGANAIGFQVGGTDDVFNRDGSRMKLQIWGV